MKYGLFTAFAVVITGCLGVIGCEPEPVSGNNGAKMPETGPVIITEDLAGKTSKARVGQTVEIHLKGNPTTGYEWKMISMETFSQSPCVLESLGIAYAPEKSEKPRVGSGGTYIAKFKAAGKGRARVTMQYLRPWEGQESPAKSLSFDITVE